MNWNVMKHALAEMKWIEKYYKAYNSSNEMNWNIMKHAIAVMKWIEILWSIQ